MKTPRPYQIDFVKQCALKLKEHNSIIAQSPTGSGKTFMMLMMISRGLIKGKTFLVLTESKKIFNQLVNEFNAYQINDKTPKHLAIYSNKCYVAMSQTLSKRKAIINQFNDLDNLILFIDEAHIGTSTKTIEQINAPKIGFTATPAWRWAKFLPELYNDIVTGLQVEDLIQLKALSPYRHIGRKKIDSSDLQIKGGEFTEKSQETAFGKTQVYDGLYEDLKNIKYRKGVIYVASIKQCDEVHKNLINHGYNCVKFHSKLEDGNKQLNEFHTSDICNLMVSVAALTKGYDFPLIDLVVLFRSTTSLPLYLQMIGRGGRPLPDKLFFTCLDYGLNFERFGAWDADRDWSKLWLPQKKSYQEQPAPMKECPSCESFLFASARVCRFCGYEFPVQEKEYEQGELIDFKDLYTPLIGKNIMSLMPAQLAIYARTKNRSQEAIRIAKTLRQFHKLRNLYFVKQSRGYFPEQHRQNYLQEFGKEMGYKPNWYAVQTSDIDARIKTYLSTKKESSLLQVRNFKLQ